MKNKAKKTRHGRASRVITGNCTGSTARWPIAGGMIHAKNEKNTVPLTLRARTYVSVDAAQRDALLSHRPPPLKATKAFNSIVFYLHLIAS